MATPIFLFSEQNDFLDTGQCTERLESQFKIVQLISTTPYINFETCLSEVATQNDAILMKTRDYIDQCQSVDESVCRLLLAPAETNSRATHRGAKRVNQ